MTKYEKIAQWIIDQDVARGIKSKDIKEIAETIFDTPLTATGIKYVKEELLKRDYTKILDKKFEDSRKAQLKVWLRNKNSKDDLDKICKALNVTYKILKEGPTEMTVELKGDAIESVYDDLVSLKMASTSLGALRYTDCKFKDNLNLQKTTLDYIKEALDDEGIEYEVFDDLYGEIAPYDVEISITNGDTSRADDIICSIVGEAYEWVRDREGNRVSCKIATDQDMIDEMNDSQRITDSKPYKLSYCYNIFWDDNYDKTHEDEIKDLTKEAKKYGVKIADWEKLTKGPDNIEVTFEGDLDNLKKMFKHLGLGEDEWKDLLEEQLPDVKLEDGCKWIVYLNGEPYYTAHSEDEANRIESQIYSASDTEDDFQAYYGSYPDVRIKKVCDSKFRDSYKSEDIKGLYDEGMYVEEIHDILDRVYPDYINTESLDDVPDKVWDKVYDELEKRLRQSYKENPNDVLTKAIEIFNLGDSKVKDEDNLVGKKISWDRRALYGRILSKNDPLTNKTSIEETSTGKVYFVSTRLLQKAINNGEAKIRDSKLPRTQKIWYGEELEKVIDPRYLRRNYINKKTKTKTTTRRRRKK